MRLPEGYTLLHSISSRAARVRTSAGTTAFAKCLLPRFAAEPAAVEMLRREAEILKKLAESARPAEATPRLILYHDAPPCLVTEWIDGRPAPAVAIAQTNAFAAVRAALLSLETIHEAADQSGPLAIVHGDLSRENILWGTASESDGMRATFVDFEFGSIRGSGPLNDGSMRGTVAYLAPECARGLQATQRSDLFALGAVLYQRLVGLALRTQSGPASLVAAGETVPDLTSLECLGRTGAVVAQLLRFEPAARPASARAARAMLESTVQFEG
jgi:serine/threonine protein kinase